MNTLVSRLEAWLYGDLGVSPENWKQRIRLFPKNLIRVFVTAVYKSLYDRLPFKASGLTLTTALSIVPLLAVSFSLAKGLGMGEALRKMVFQQAVGVQPEILERILKYVENTNARTLGIVGTLFLLYTVTKTLSTMEEAFNEIWHVPEHRPLYRKFTDYFSVTLVCPLLFLAATMMTASLSSTTAVTFLMRSRYIGPLVAKILSLSPYVLSWIAISVLYQILPNTRIPVLFALSGGLIASILWQAVQVLYITFQIGVAKYNAIYGSFALLPLFLIWLYLSWTILLFGAEVAEALHGFGRLHPRSIRNRAAASGETLVTKLYLIMAYRFLNGKPPWPAMEYAIRLGVNPDWVNEILGRLLAKGLVVKLSDSPPRYLPGRDLERLSLTDVLRAVEEAPVPMAARTREEEVVEEILEEIREICNRAPMNVPLKTLLQ